MQDREQAEDIVQNSFVNLFHKINGFNAEKPFQPWFMKSVVNNALSTCRKNKRLVSMDAFDNQENQFESLFSLSEKIRSIEDNYITNEIRSSIWSALEKLNPKQRAVIVLRYYLNLNENELIEELQAPKSTVKWLLYAARRKLRELLGALHDEDFEDETVLTQKESHL